MWVMITPMIFSLPSSLDNSGAGALIASAVATADTALLGCCCTALLPRGFPTR